MRVGGRCNFAKGKDYGQQTTDNRLRTTDNSHLAGCARRMGKRPDGALPLFIGRTDARSKSRGQTCLYYALREGGR